MLFGKGILYGHIMQFLYKKRVQRVWWKGKENKYSSTPFFPIPQKQYLPDKIIEISCKYSIYTHTQKEFLHFAFYQNFLQNLFPRFLQDYHYEKTNLL